MVAVTAAILSVSSCAVTAAPEPSFLLTVRSRPGEELVFDPGELHAPNNSLIRITFTNVSSVDHNLVFVDPLAARTRQIVLPGESDVVDLQTPGVGTYRFVCTVHEGMEGTLTVE